MPIKMVTIRLSEKDAATASKIIANKAMEMYEKGAEWRRGENYLSCFDIGKLSNKILSTTGRKYDFDAAFKPKRGRAKKELKNKQ